MIKFNLVNISLEAKHFKKLGLPILGSQLVMYAMTTTDYIMAGYFSANDLAGCLLYTSPSPRDAESSRMPSSA